MKIITRTDRRFLAVAAIYSLIASLVCVAFGVAVGRAQLTPDYDALGVARRPLVIANGVTEQLPTADYLSSVGGVTTNATAAAAGDLETTTLTCSGAATLTGGFTLGADSSAGSHKITNLANGSSAQEAAAFGQIATAVNAALSGTSGRSCRFTGTNTAGNGGWTDDGTNETALGTLTSIVGANTFGETRGNVVSPTAIAANTDNYTGCATNASICQISATGSTRVLTGMTGGAAGRILTLTNVGASIAVEFDNEHANSTAANRFTLPGAQDWTLYAGCSFTFEYDGTNSRWKLKSYGCHSLPNITISRLTTTSTMSISGNVSETAGYFQFGSIISGGSITNPTDNYAISGTCVEVRLSTSGGTDATITGINSSSNDGRLLKLVNTGSSGAITLSNQDTNSSAGNRFLFPDGQNVVIPAGGQFTLQFNNFSGGDWRPWAGQNVTPTLMRTSMAGADPTLSSCGTSPTIIGSDGAGTVTIGTGGSATDCTITFATTWTTNAPACTLTSRMSARTDLYISAASTTAITVSNAAAAAWPASGVFSYQCVGTP
jgi:hypothetical protein